MTPFLFSVGTWLLFGFLSFVTESPGRNPRNAVSCVFAILSLTGLSVACCLFLYAYVMFVTPLLFHGFVL